MNFHTWHLAVRCQLRTLSVYSLLTVIAFWQLLTVNSFRFTANCLLTVFITYYQLLTVVFTAHIAFFLLYVFTAYCKLLTVRVYSLLTVVYCTCLQLSTICLMFVLTAYRQLFIESFNNCLILTVRVYTLPPTDNCNVYYLLLTAFCRSVFTARLHLIVH